MTYHSEVVGSLLRPTYLVEARKQFEAGWMDGRSCKSALDHASSVHHTYLHRIVSF